MTTPSVSAHAVDRWQWRVRAVSRPDAAQEVLDLANETYHPHDGDQWVCMGVDGKTLCCMFRGATMISVYWMGVKP